MADQDVDRTGELRELCARVVELASQAGATEAEAYAERSREASVTVANGEIEELSEAVSKGVGLRVVRGGRLGFASTTDFDRSSLESLVGRALALAKEAAKDAANSLPGPKELSPSARPRVEGLFDPAIAELDPGWKLSQAFELERSAQAQDPRCVRFNGSGAGEAVVETALASSHGLLDSERATHAFLWCSPVAEQNGSLQTSSWSDHRRQLSELEAPEAVGREAARRTVRMLGARRPPSARVPVVLDPVMSAAFFGALSGAVSGELVRKRSSFLADRLGERIGSELVTLVDDGRLPGTLGAAAFDAEGVPTRRTPILERGVLASFLYDHRTARKAKTKTTGNARRGYASLPGIGAHQLVVEPGTRSPDEIIAGVARGLYVTAMLGTGANVVTGDYSRGANGLWIDHGELAFPVHEVTVAGQLLVMLETIDAVGSDLLRRGSVFAPTIRFAELAVGGG